MVVVLVLNFARGLSHTYSEVTGSALVSEDPYRSTDRQRIPAKQGMPSRKGKLTVPHGWLSPADRLASRVLVGPA